MSLTPRELYYKFICGQLISDDDLISNVLFYEDLSRKMNEMGPVFKLSAREITYVYEQLQGFADARGLVLKSPEGVIVK